jgi:hypothetical protein
MTKKIHVSFKEYRNLLFGLAYKKPVMKILLCVDLLSILWILAYYSRLLPVPKPLIYQYITVMLITLVQPGVIYWTIKRNYESSNHLREPLEIKITPTEIKIKGDSFYTEIAWDKVFKIDEQVNWFLVYQNTLSAIIIPKKGFHNAELLKFRNILKTIKKVPVHLKKE